MDKEGEDLWRSVEYANAINSLDANLPHNIRWVRSYAELRYEKYAALIEAGFTPEQALTIVIQTPIMG